MDNDLKEHRMRNSFFFIFFHFKIDDSRLCASTCMENMWKITEFKNENLQVKILFVYWIELNLIMKGARFEKDEVNIKEKEKQKLFIAHLHSRDLQNCIEILGRLVQRHLCFMRSIRRPVFIKSICCIAHVVTRFCALYIIHNYYTWLYH